MTRSLLLVLLCALPVALVGCPGSKTKGGKSQGAAGPPITQHPVGTGPWRFKSWKKDEKIVLLPNPDYWGGKPEPKKLIMVPIAENASRLAQLEQGKAQVLDGLRPSDARMLAKSKAVKVIRQPGMNMGYLAMNVEKPPFDNIKVRQAIALAIDRQKIVDLNFQGYAIAARNPVPPVIPGHDDSAPAVKPNLERARALLKESGVKLPIKTQLWHMPIPRPYMPEPKKIAAVIAEGLKQIGIEAELVSWKWEIYLKKTKDGEHPMCLLGWTADVADADNFLYVLLGKDNRGKTNVSLYANEEVNKQLLAAQSTVDEAKRLAIYRAVQKTIREEAPMVPLVHSDQLMGIKAGLEGFSLHSTGRKDFRGIKGSGTIVFARGGEASKLDPALVDDGESVVVCSQIYEGLVRYAQGSTKIEPALASSWSVSPDGKSWTFELRKGVKFHDETPFDAEAVKFCFARLKPGSEFHDPTMQNLNLYAAIEKIEALESHKIRFQLSRPVASFLGNLTVYTAWIVSPTAVKNARKH